MKEILSEDCIYNILGHIKSCWKYDYPTGKTLENAFYNGIRPFYSNTKCLGSPSTIVDVGKETQAFDIKGSKTLGHVSKIVKSANHDKNLFVEQNIPKFGKVKVRIPQSIITQVRRPKIDLKGYKGDAKASLDEQIEDYHQFAIRTTNKDGFQELYSVVLLYGIDDKKGLKSIFLTIEKFHIPEISNYDIGKKEDGTPCSYRGIDHNGLDVFVLSSFNKGSSNFYKRFHTSQGILMSWPIEEENNVIFTKNQLTETCAVKSI